MCKSQQLMQLVNFVHIVTITDKGFQASDGCKTTQKYYVIQYNLGTILLVF